MPSIITKINTDIDSINSMLSEILRLSQQMVCAARDKQWDAVVDLENKRAPHFELLKSVMDTAEETPEVTDSYRQKIIAIIDSDQEVEKLAESQKQTIAEEAIGLDSSRKAVNAYLDNVSS